jgi:tRNA pseudouridine38/39 synthase
MLKSDRDGQLDKLDKLDIVDTQLDIKEPAKVKGKQLDFSLQKHLAFKFMYNGKNYEGLVVQSHTQNTIESQILNAIKKASLIQNLESSNYARCGRTDAGVSSTGNVFSIYLRYKKGMKPSDYVKIINNLLPDDILITGATEVDDSFDARFSCLYREYKYFFLKAGMNIEKIKLAAKKLEGVHNFKNFCKLDKSDSNYLTKNYERRIYEFKVEKYDKLIFPHEQAQITHNSISDHFEMYNVTIKGSAFLWHQVRCMMGILFLIGKGHEDLDIIDHMFDLGSERFYNFEIASEIPLVLSDCQFEGVYFENTIENYAENFFSISRIYESNLTQIAINSFFFRNLTSLIRSNLPLISSESQIVQYMEEKYRRKKKYTKLLNHKMNRNKK